ncbi:MAG: ATP-dependent helicase [Candidatus Woesearchaeota archaeon]
MAKYKEKPDSEKALLKMLNPAVKEWFFRRFEKFSLPQLYSVKEIHSRNNILISAPTGATKTLTAFLSILNELVDSAQKGILEDRIYCVYVSPLKALNNDIHKNLIEPLREIEGIAGSSLGIRVGVRTGDTTASEKSAMLRKPPHILITTPESLAIILSSRKFIEHIRKVEWTIVDEIHALAENKRGVHLSLSMERLQRISSHTTRVGLSATIAPLEEIAKFLAGNEDVESGSAGGRRGAGRGVKKAGVTSDKAERDCLIVDTQFLKKMDLRVLSPVPDLIDTEHGEMHYQMYALMDRLIQQHKTTLIFTNTRAATERVVHHLKERFPKNYTENIGAHHGSLSKEMRYDIEEKLRRGELKAVVSSTSLELGIDIGFVDLVILLGSPKSVARALQRIGRSGHRLHETTKGRIIVLDRDDLVECSVLLKSAVDKRIDRIHIPTNCLDVLAQHLHGIAIEDRISFEELYSIVRGSYCYGGLSREDFREVVEYLAGKFISLEDRNVYAKIWYDEETGMIGRKGRMSRVIHMTNIGTIPDETGVKVKIGDRVIGVIDEAFLEKLKRNDVFVLGGNVYQFLHSRGMVAQVRASPDRPPTVPSWFSEMLPLSFDLAMEISGFRRLMEEKLKAGRTREEIIDFVLSYLYIDENGANAIYEYFSQQHDYAGEIPNDRKMLIEHYTDEAGKKYAVFHTVYGRRVNDCLSRAVGFAIGRTQHRDVEIGVSDNGFYVASSSKVNVLSALRMLKSKEIDRVMANAIDKTEVLKRRFRHCATRALMILRNYAGRTKRVGRQQVSSMILMNAVKRINPDFFILKEARREVLEDLMDIESAKRILRRIENNDITIREISTTVPSPFAFNLVLQGKVDIMKIEERMEFLRRMHKMVQAKISLGKR